MWWAGGNELTISAYDYFGVARLSLSAALVQGFVVVAVVVYSWHTHTCMD